MGFGWILALLWGGVSFAAVFYIQMPIQSALGDAILGSELPIWLRNLILIAPSGVVQEFFKALLPVTLLLIGLRIGTSRNLLGPFAGAGFGLVEAIILVGLYSGDIGWAAIAERASAIFFHVGLTSIAVGSGNWRRILWGLPFAMLLHSLSNFAAVFYMKSLGVLGTELLIAAVAFTIWCLSNLLYGKGKE